jgi:hypothetical protein
VIDEPPPKAPSPPKSKRRSPPPLSFLLAPQLSGQITGAVDLAASH